MKSLIAALCTLMVVKKHQKTLMTRYVSVYVLHSPEGGMFLQPEEFNNCLQSGHTC